MTPPTTSALTAWAADSDIARDALTHRQAIEGLGSWAPVALDGYLSGDYVPEKTDYLKRSDGRNLIYAGRLHSFSGEPESGKSWLMVATAAQIFDEIDNGAVVYVDFEDTVGSVVNRLRTVGATREQIQERFVYVRPDEPIRGRDQLDNLVSLIGDDVWLVILDGVTEGMVLHGLDPLSNTDIAAWRETVVRPLLGATPGSTAVIELDHVVKDKESRGRYAIGGIHKLAGVDVAYGVKVLTPFGRGRSGKVKITVHKDRPGYVRGFAQDSVAAIVDIESHGDDQVCVTLHAADDQAVTAPASTFRPTVLMERVSRAIEDKPGLTRRALREAVRGKHDAKYLALELLVTEGYVECRDGAGWPTHHPIRPFRETGPQLAPTGPQGPAPATGPLAPLPTGQGPGADFTGTIVADELAPDADAELDRLRAKGLAA